MTAAPLLTVVLPDASHGLAAAELYDDPPGLAPLPEEEPLIAKSVAKRRNEFGGHFEITPEMRENAQKMQERIKARGS